MDGKWVRNFTYGPFNLKNKDVQAFFAEYLSIIYQLVKAGTYNNVDWDFVSDLIIKS
jgi:hypothetical protein